MKRKWMMLCALLMLPASLWAAAESKPAAAGALPFKEVSGKVSQAFCSKMEQCSKEKIPVGQCNGQMNDAFLQGYNALAADKKPQIAADQLKLCVKSIEASTCESLKKASSLEGCDFIGQLAAQ